MQRLVNKADFERLLAERPRQRSAHFAVHHVASTPTRPRRELATPKLSTSLEELRAAPVDDLPAARWLGCMAPKRHARRAVTRNLVKRQMRSAFDRSAATLPPGLWLLRLRAPWAGFGSAASPALAAALRAELDGLLAAAASR